MARIVNWGDNYPAVNHNGLSDRNLPQVKVKCVLKTTDRVLLFLAWVDNCRSARGCFLTVDRSVESVTADYTFSFHWLAKNSKLYLDVFAEYKYCYLFYAVLEKWFHDLSSQNKFPWKWENKMLYLRVSYFFKICKAKLSELSNLPQPQPLFNGTAVGLRGTSQHM